MGRKWCSVDRWYFEGRDAMATAAEKICRNNVLSASFTLCKYTLDPIYVEICRDIRILPVRANVPANRKNSIQNLLQSFRRCDDDTAPEPSRKRRRKKMLLARNGLGKIHQCPFVILLCSHEVGPKGDANQDAHTLKHPKAVTNEMLFC